MTRDDLVELRRLQRTDTGRYRQWFRDRGGTDPWESNVKIVLRGDRPTPVRIIDIRPDLRCGPPLDGTLMYSPPAGADTNIRIGFDLDEIHPVARFLTHNDLTGEYFAEKTISLRPGEEVVLGVTAQTRRQSCAYRLRLDLLVAGRRESLTVDDNGRPFLVTALLTDQNGQERFAGYRALYAGGVASRDGDWHLADPDRFG